MRWTLPFVLGLASFAASSASAACPTAADLETGIRGTLADGGTDTYTRFAPGIVQGLFQEPGDTVQFRSLLAQGVYLIETVELQDGEVAPGSKSVFSFPAAPLDLPLPVAEGSYVVELTRKFAGESWQKETQTHQFGPLTQATYGTCSYQMIPVTISWSGSEDLETVHYLPELGFGYLAAFEIAGEGAPDVYTYVSFEVISP